MNLTLRFPDDRVIPREDGQCQFCKQARTVAFEVQGKMVHDTELCGPCYFGTAQALDSSKWEALD